MSLCSCPGCKHHFADALWSLQSCSTAATAQSAEHLPVGKEHFTRVQEGAGSVLLRVSGRLLAVLVLSPLFPDD